MALEPRALKILMSHPRKSVANNNGLHITFFNNAIQNDFFYLPI